MSQVKNLKALGFEFEDPGMWDFIEALDKLPEFLEEKRQKRIAREKFVEEVWLQALIDAGVIEKAK